MFGDDSTKKPGSEFQLCRLLAGTALNLSKLNFLNSKIGKLREIDTRNRCKTYGTQKQ